MVTFLCGGMCIANLDFQGRLAREIEFNLVHICLGQISFFVYDLGIQVDLFGLKVGMATPLCVEALPITIIQQMKTISINLFLITVEDALRNKMLHVGKLCPLDQLMII
jgi:hypothetical protein